MPAPKTPRATTVSFLIRHHCKYPKGNPGVRSRREGYDVVQTVEGTDRTETVYVTWVGARWANASRPTATELRARDVKLRTMRKMLATRGYLTVSGPQGFTVVPPSMAHLADVFEVRVLSPLPEHKPRGGVACIYVEHDWAKAQQRRVEQTEGPFTGYVFVVPRDSDTKSF